VPGSTIIYDVKSTRLLEDVIQAADGQALMCKSGYSNIKAKMAEVDAPLSGEMTGHIIFNDRWFGVDDALYSACRLLELLASDPLERTSTEVFEALPNLQNTPEIFIDLAEGESQRFMRQLGSEAKFTGAKVINLDGLRVEYPSGWGLVRASNTVSGLTLRFEADTLDNLHHIQQQFKQQMLQVKPTLALHF
jgi:phosphomannomutase/phosphoglucomutase